MAEDLVAAQDGDWQRSLAHPPPALHREPLRRVQVILFIGVLAIQNRLQDDEVAILY